MHEQLVMYFLLKHSWFLLYYILRHLGICPCQRNGDNGLESVPACHYWGRIIFTNILLYVLNGLFFYLLSFHSSVKQILKVWLEIFEDSRTTIVALNVNTAIYYSLYFIFIFYLKNISIVLVHFEDYCKGKANFTQATQQKRHGLIVYIYVFPYIFLTMAGTFLLDFVAIYYIKQKLDLSNILTISFLLVHQLNYWIMSAPTIYFVFVYFELTHLNIVWCSQLMMLNSEPDIDLVEEIQIFTEGLYRVAKYFSGFLFWIIPMFLVQIILIGYLIVTSMIDDNVTSWTNHGILCGFTLLFLSFIHLLFWICHLSQRLSNQVNKLQNLISSGTQIESTDAETICSQLEKFGGFDAKGYFTLNHSLVTGMTVR